MNETATSPIREAARGMAGIFVTLESWQGERPEPGDSWSYGNWSRSSEKEGTATHFLPDLLSGSDYSGSSVERSNYLVFRDEFGAHVVDVFGGYGTYAIAIPLDWTGEEAEKAAEMLNGLADYPVIDEDELCKVEHGAEDEAWTSWASYDFRRELEKRLRDFELSEEEEERLTDAIQECGQRRLARAASPRRRDCQ